MVFLLLSRNFYVDGGIVLAVRNHSDVEHYAVVDSPDGVILVLAKILNYKLIITGLIKRNNELKRFTRS
jgi:hypothetical protein